MFNLSLFNPDSYKSLIHSMSHRESKPLMVKKEVIYFFRGSDLFIYIYIFLAVQKFFLFILEWVKKFFFCFFNYYNFCFVFLQSNIGGQKENKKGGGVIYKLNFFVLLFLVHIFFCRGSKNFFWGVGHFFSSVKKKMGGRELFFWCSLQKINILEGSTKMLREGVLFYLFSWFLAQNFKDQIEGVMWHVTHDMWHVTHDMWHVAHDFFQTKSATKIPEKKQCKKCKNND